MVLLAVSPLPAGVSRRVCADCNESEAGPGANSQGGGTADDAVDPNRDMIAWLRSIHPGPLAGTGLGMASAAMPR